MFLLLAVAWGGQARAQLVDAPPRKAGSDLAAMDLEQLMRVEVVVAASKRAQQSRAVPSFVTVVTAAEIKDHGYQTLAAVLKAIPSFYITNDRNYSYVGVRGFDRPGDYNSRILLLLNGLRTNDNVYDEAYIGEEFSIDMSIVDRIEIIRGPSAAIYGSNAFFAVINVVTKKGRDLQGGEVSASAASYRTYSERASYGRTFHDDIDVIASASHSASTGQQLYFHEFDTPETNHGISSGNDYENSEKLFGRVSTGGFAVEGMSSWRDKGIPTASFETRFNDPRTHTIDGLTLGSATYARTLASGGTLTARAYTARWSYAGRYAYDSTTPPEHDNAVGQWWGTDVDFSQSVGRHFITAGAEFRNNFRMDQNTWDPQPFTVYTDLHDRSTRWGVYTQDEIALSSSVMAYTGLRVDHYQSFGAAATPRVGLIYTPAAGTTIKAIAGRAFRAPNAYEMYYSGFDYQPNPNLKPEHITTLELIAQQFLGSDVQVSAAAFRNRLTDLVSQARDTVTGNLVFGNSGRIESDGIEVGLQVNPGWGPTGELTYSLQRTWDLDTQEELTNSPRRMAKAQIRVPMPSHLTAGFDAQYESGRRTQAGNVAPAYTVANLTLGSPTLLGRVDVSASVYNLFDARYGSPTADTHVQDVIIQDGRNFRVKTTLHF